MNRFFAIVTSFQVQKHSLLQYLAHSRRSPSATKPNPCVIWESFVDSFRNLSSLRCFINFVLKLIIVRTSTLNASTRLTLKENWVLVHLSEVDLRYLVERWETFGMMATRFLSYELNVDFELRLMSNWFQAGRFSTKVYNSFDLRVCNNKTRKLYGLSSMLKKFLFFSTPTNHNRTMSVWLLTDKTHL